MNQDQKSIFIIGATSTGKTTLLNALKNHYNEQPNLQLSQTAKPAIICEVARSVLKRLGLDRTDLSGSPERALTVQQAIIQAQYDAETTAVEGAATWFISDRSGIDPIIYTQFLVGEEAANQLLKLPTWGVLEHNMKSGTVLLCEAGCNWLVDDGTRLMPQGSDDWIRHDNAFRKLLMERDISYTIVPKDMVNIAERVNLAVDAHARNK